MASGAPMPLVASLLFLLAALCSAGGWRVGPWVGLAGGAILVGALAARGMRAGYWPLASVYELALASALAIGLAAWIAGVSQEEQFRAVQGVAFLLAAGLLVYARLALPASDRDLQLLDPVMDSVWLPLHAGASALAHGALAVAAAAAVVRLWQSAGGTAAQPGVAWLQETAIAAGYPLLTLSMLLGMVWAQVAWGRYWGWDLKEVWTCATWLVYTAHWHLRSLPGWKGRRLAWLAVGGYCGVLFTFLGTAWLARSVGLQNLQSF